MNADSTRKHTDYTLMEHHAKIPASADSGDPSRPQGDFWHQNERPGADAINDVQLEAGVPIDEMDESQAGRMGEGRPGEQPTYPARNGAKALRQ